MDSDGKGHEFASISGLTSEAAAAAPLGEGLFQTGLKAAPPLSELSAAEELKSSTGTAAEGKSSVEEDGAAATGSDSPRTTWFHGEEAGRRVARRDRRLSEEWRGEWLPVIAM